MGGKECTHLSCFVSSGDCNKNMKKQQDHNRISILIMKQNVLIPFNVRKHHVHLTLISVDVPPSGHCAHVPRCGAGCGQGDRLDVLVHGDGVGQLHQHDVVVQGLVVVTLMPVDSIHWHVLLGALVHPDVVVTQNGNL